MYVLMLIGAINRRTEVKKHICDLCNGELVEPRKFGQDGIESGIAAIFQDVSVFRARAVYKITKFTLSLPFGMANHKDMDICEKCMNDFKEFVQRKQSYQSGDKK
jgi:protein-arginine kinase activator protein McsA